MFPMNIHVKEHRHTGLLVATANPVPGFILHADSVEELEEKLPTALTEWLKAIGKPISPDEEVFIERENDAGFDPPTYIANTKIEACA